LLIKTAEYQCPVRDVYQATDAIERMTQSLGGMVTDSKMEQQSVRVQEVNLSRDSIRRMKTFIPVAHLTLKVPVQLSDSVLHAVQALSASPEVPLRHIYYSDVTLEVQGNRLINETFSRNDHSDEALCQARKTEDVLAVNDYMNNGAAQQIARQLNNKALLHEVQYATIHIGFEQPEQVVFTMLANTENLARASFWQRLGNTLYGSIDLLQQIVLLLIQIWPLLALAAGVLLVIRLNRRSRAAANILTGR
jgi:hypothetical protein